ncbi:MAG: helix-turn-helix domain-containing protein, partial [Proteobacteria bacterium]|nr:helix-turn-helix domain-containing protein [Pseudomonadota bacterium]
MIASPRIKIAPTNTKLYRSLGSLIKDYRKWRGVSQETLAESIKISARELQYWEADGRSARVENLHDLSEVVGIPMQVCVALNAQQPVWYSLRTRRFTYSFIEQALFSSPELLKSSQQSDEGIITKYDTVKTDKQIRMILSCHCDIYGTEKSFAGNVIKKAGLLLPDLNLIAFDSWGHYVGHQICLPIANDSYEQLKKQKIFEGGITEKEIIDIISLGEGVFYFYSMYTANTSAAQAIMRNNHRYLDEIEFKENYLVARNAVTADGRNLSDIFGMKRIFSKKPINKNIQTETVPAMYEAGLDVIITRAGKSYPLVKESAAKSDKKDFIEDAGYKESAVNPDKKKYDLNELYQKFMEAKKAGNFPFSVDFPFDVDAKKRRTINIDNDPNQLKSNICTNPNCDLFNKKNKGNIVFNGTYRKKDGTLSRRYLCKKCGKSFCARAGSIFYGLRSSEEKVLMSLKLLQKGKSIQEVSKALGVKFDTVRHW